MNDQYEWRTAISKASKAPLNLGLANECETSVVCEVYDALQALRIVLIPSSTLLPFDIIYLRTFTNSRCSLPTVTANRLILNQSTEATGNCRDALAHKLLKCSFLIIATLHFRSAAIVVSNLPQQSEERDDQHMMPKRSDFAH